MTAQADVTPGSTYHIKLAIADEGNYRYDSAIFLGGGFTYSIASWFYNEHKLKKQQK